MDQFLKADKHEILSDAKFRNKKIIELIHLVSGYNQPQRNKLSSLMKASDSETYQKENAISKEVKKRRALKTKKEER